MKIVVIGGTGLIGSKLVRKLRDHGHQVVPASPDTGVNTITGEGLTEALTGAKVVVDVSNSPSMEDGAVLKFFETSTGNLLAAEKAAGVGHHVALSVVGTERLSESGYFRGKIAQEKLIRRASIPYSIVHATEFFEFIKRIADEATEGNKVRLASVLIQPMAAEDVASAVGMISEGKPVNGIVEVAGPQQFRLDELIRRVLSEVEDARYQHVIQDKNRFRYRAKIELVVAQLDQSVGFRDEQRRKLVELIMSETQTPTRFGQYDYYLVMYQAGQIAEAKLKPLFEDRQWALLNRQLNQMRGMEQFLRIQGLLPPLKVVQPPQRRAVGPNRRARLASETSP